MVNLKCLILLAAVAFLPLAGCVGTHARDEVQGPQILRHWLLLDEAAAPGVELAPGFTEALQVGDRLRARVEWQAARRAVLDAIETRLEAKAIGAHYALSLQEGVLRIDQAVEVYSRR